MHGAEPHAHTRSAGDRTFGLSTGHRPFGVNTSQAGGSCAPRQAQQHGFSLVIERVGSGNFVQKAVGKQALEVLVTYVSRCRFQTKTASGRLGRGIRRRGVQGQAMQASQVSDELLVGIGVAAANLVVQVNQREDYAEFGAKLQQEPQKGNGISAAGDGHAHSIAGVQQFLAANIAADALSQFVHRSMVLHRELVSLRSEQTIEVRKSARLRICCFKNG